MSELLERMHAVQARVKAACERSGRSEDSVCLIAVSKTKPLENILELYQDGQRVFGENKVQEMYAKHESAPEDISWHLIGHLQRNKVKYMADFVTMIHSVDSVRLAETISKEAQKHGRTIPVLVEVNVAGEESKFGVSPEETLSLVEQIAPLPGITIRGLMTIAPFVKDPEENRPVFRTLKQLSVDINAKNINNVNMCELSMGMTNDFEVAIEEGATFVRVGTAIFGARDYSIS
ncbi:MAG: YggS family pyridoxal phosphate-dependent enzyme [Bilifractor sp.]|jgi:pyridoxal phosphate enzyme (YggS family)